MGRAHALHRADPGSIPSASLGWERGEKKQGEEVVKREKEKTL